MYMEFKDKLNGRIGRNSTHSIFDQVLSIGMNVLLSILFSRYLGAESLGQYTLGLALVGILAVFSNFGKLNHCQGKTSFFCKDRVETGQIYIKF